MDVKRTVHRLLRRAGYDVVGYVPIAHPLARRKRLLDTLGVDLVLDVGANVGQYGRQLRDLGYGGRIVSFEPLPAAYAELERKARADGAWDALPYALSDADGEQDLHVTRKSVFSSLQASEALLTDTDPSAGTVGVARVTVRTLDGLFEGLRQGARSVWLKLDVQGHEARVLAGAVRALPSLAALQMEMSLTPLYEGERDLSATLQWAEAAGYALWALEPGFSDSRTGRLLQVDGVFVRREPA